MQVSQQKVVPFELHRSLGAWLPFDGNRIAFRNTISEFISSTFLDPRGILEFLNGAPVWQSSISLHLSYAHTEGLGLLLTSKSDHVGVDLERVSRMEMLDYFAIAKRFFHRDEFQFLASLPVHEAQNEFLTLWLKKEAFAKFTREGLAKTLSKKLSDQLDVQFTELLCPSPEYRAIACTKRL